MRGAYEQDPGVHGSALGRGVQRERFGHGWGCADVKLGSYKFQLPTYIMSPDLGLQGGFMVQGNTLRLDGLGEQGTLFDLIATR